MTRPDATVRGSNYIITADDPIGAGGQKGKARANIAAIRVLKQIESEQRPATTAEQAILVRYVGWGGIPQAFYNPSTRKIGKEWKDVADELEQLLTADELTAARASTLNAHYTSPDVIRAMFDALTHLGFTGGRVLEPALGVGHFIGLTPDALRSAVTWHGTELDSLSGRIAQQLYPRADVRVQGFEQMRVPDGFFDAAIGNPPFGSVQLSDPRYDKHRFLIHDYFFAKSLDLVRPGGVLLYITSHGTMDKKDPKARRYIADKAQLLGAVRLPSSAFEKNAMTSVTTDILVFQRTGEGVESRGEAFGGLGTHTNRRGETVTINEYFVKHPEQMLGVMSSQGTMYRKGDELTLEPDASIDMATALPAALARLPQNVVTKRAARTAATTTVSEDAAREAASDLPGTFSVRNGKLMQVVDGVWAPAPVPPAHVARVSALVGIRDAVNTILRTQLDGASDSDIMAAIAEGKRRYDAFTKQYGPVLQTTRTVQKRLKKDGTPVVIERQPNLKYFDADPLYYRVLAAEEYSQDTNTGKASALLVSPVLGVTSEPASYDNAIDALRAVITTRGTVDVAWMAEKTGMSEDAVRDQLRGRIYRDPESGGYQTAARYLSGNVRAKLAQAEQAAGNDPAFKENIDALRAVQPKDIAPNDIEAQLGAAWLPTQTIDAFIKHLFGENAGDTRVSSLAGTNWSVRADWRLIRDERIRTTYGTEDMPFPKLLENTLNAKGTTVRKPDGEGGHYVDAKASELAKQRQTVLRDAWAKWLWQDDARAEALARRYNDRFNVWVQPEYDGSDLNFPGAVQLYKGKPFRLRPHQSNAVARYLENGNSYLAHVVGAGKTFTAAAIAVEARRLSLAKKPVIVTPNHMLGQWTTEFLAMYPTAKLLVADAEEFAPAERATFVAKAAGQEWDAIIIKSSAFTKLPVSYERQIALIEEEKDLLQSSVADLKKSGGQENRSGIKELEKRLKNLDTRLRRLNADDRKDQQFTFEEMGVDLLIVDEAHEYKNLFLISQIQGLSQPGSQRAYDMYLKTRVLHDVNPGRGLVFLSGTPISNSFAELFTIQRYLQPNALRDMGVEQFDQWVSTFAQAETRLEKRATGQYKPKSRYTKFGNLPELRGAFGQVIDVQTQEDLKLPRPPVIGGQAEVIVAPQTDALKAYVKALSVRAGQLAKRPEKGADNFLSITNDGLLAGLDIRLVAPAGDDPSSKVNQAVEKIHEIYQESTEYKGVQLVFLDLSLPGSEETEASMKRGGTGVNVYDDMREKLVARGIPRAEIQFAQEHKSDDKKADLFADVRAGKVRVVFTSTPLMGAGTNVQDRLVALHRMDVPWRPSDVEQSEGRILRQGNVLYNEGTIPGVRLLRYVTKGSYDEQIWSMVLGKQRMVSSVMKGTGTERTVSDADEVTVSYAQAMAAAADNPLVLEKIELEMQVSTLRMLASAHADEQRSMRWRKQNMSEQLLRAESRVAAVDRDLAKRQDISGKQFSITLGDKSYTDRAAAAKALGTLVETYTAETRALGDKVRYDLGSLAGFPLALEIFQAERTDARRSLRLVGALEHTAQLADGQTPAGMLASAEYAAKSMDKQREMSEREVETSRQALAELTQALGAPFPQLAQLEQAQTRLAEVEVELEKSAEPDPVPEAAADEDADDDADEDMRESEGDDLDEDEDGNERYAYSDPVAAAIGLLVRRLRRLFNERTRESDPIVESRIEEVEARLRAAQQGLPVVPWQARIRETLGELRASFARHFPELDTTRDRVHAAAHELLLNAERSGSWSRAMAADQLLQVVRGLTKAEVQAMTRKLALDDILKDLDAGRYQDGRSLPFGYPDRAAVEADLADVEATITNSSALAKATDRRQRLARALTQRLVAIDALPESVLDDERYFHRQVLEYARARAAQQGTHFSGAGTPQEVRQRKRGFQRGRVGGGDFNLAYQEAEYEWVAQAHQILALHETLAAIKRLADQTPRLKAEANALNLSGFYEATVGEQARDLGMTISDFLAQNKQADPLLPFRQKIAIARGRLATMLANGDLDVPARFESMVADWLEAEESGRPFAHPQWWPFLSAMVTHENADAARQAATIFKAIHDRKALIAETLGRDYIDASDPEALAELAGPEFRAWQPEKGNLFFSALTVPEQAVANGTVGSLEGDQLRRAMVMGGRKPAWILPEGIARTMDNLTPAKGKPSNALDAALVGGVRYWKAWTLLSPARALRYNFNNLAGDTDAALLAPGVLKHVGKAARDLWAYQKERKTSEAATPELQDAMRRGVIDQGLTAVEIPDIIDLPGFERLAGSSPNAFIAFAASYWKHVRILTQWRENILRLAAYRYFQGELRAGRRRYAASNARRVDGVTDLNDRAALLARDLVGDYGNISAGGETMRDRLFPFYSWMEVNAKRYVNYFRNLPLEEEGLPAAAGRGAAAIATRLGLAGVSATVSLGAKLLVGASAAAAFMSLVAAWNWLMFPDEWEEMRSSGRDAQLIIGRSDDGRVYSLRVEGAFADFLGWVGLKDLPADVRDMVRGTADYGDLAKDAVLATPAKLINALEPTSKTLYTFLTGKQLFPDPWNPRPVKDPLGRPYGAVFDQWSMGWLYRQVLLPLGGVPAVPTPPKNLLLSLLVYQTDAGEAAYYATQGQARDWLESKGKSIGSGEPTQKAAALYYFRKASQWGESAAAEAWLQRYYALGGNRKSVRGSIDRADPLSLIAQREQRAFLLSRSPAELEQIERGREYYRRIYRANATQTARGTRPGAAPAQRPTAFDDYWSAMDRALNPPAPPRR